MDGSQTVGQSYGLNAGLLLQGLLLLQGHQLLLLGHQKGCLLLLHLFVVPALLHCITRIRISQSNCAVCWYGVRSATHFLTSSGILGCGKREQGGGHGQVRA